MTIPRFLSSVTEPLEDRDNHQIAITSEIGHMSNKLESTATVY
jgi:hypothetical protein